MPKPTTPCPACGQLKSKTANICAACRKAQRGQMTAWTRRGQYNDGRGLRGEQARIDAIVLAAWQRGDETERAIIRSRNPKMDFYEA